MFPPPPPLIRLVVLTAVLGGIFELRKSLRWRKRFWHGGDFVQTVGTAVAVMPPQVGRRLVVPVASQGENVPERIEETLQGTLRSPLWRRQQWGRTVLFPLGLLEQGRKVVLGVESYRV